MIRIATIIWAVRAAALLQLNLSRGLFSAVFSAVAKYWCYTIMQHWGSPYHVLCFVLDVCIPALEPPLCTAPRRVGLVGLVKDTNAKQRGIWGNESSLHNTRCSAWPLLQIYSVFICLTFMLPFLLVPKNTVSERGKTQNLIT